ncbi:MAG: lactate racemase domain-containing protein, partial [Promethearchaeota archaeon]
NIGRTPFGNEVLINKTYIEADIKVLITDIMLHYFAGFGGDRKSIMPGVAAKQTINFNHKMATLPEVAPGKLDGNPVHEDMFESAKLVGADFVMNIGLSSKGSIIFCESGALDTAFREAIKVYKEKVIVKIERQADILVLSQGGYPYDINYYQSLKSLHLCRRASKPKSDGGKIIFITECREGIGNSVFESCMHEYKTSEAVMKFIKESFNQGANSAYYHYKFIQNYDIQIKTSMDQAIVEGLFKLKYISDLEGNIEDTIVEVLKEKIKGLIKMRKMRGEQTEKDAKSKNNSAGKVNITGKSFYIENEDYVFLIYIIKNGSKLLIETREHRTDD